MLQDLKRVGYSWERAKVLAETHVHWRVYWRPPYAPIMVDEYQWGFSLL